MSWKYTLKVANLATEIAILQNMLNIMFLKKDSKVISFSPHMTFYDLKWTS